MKFKIHSDISYQVSAPTTFIFNVHALRTNTQQILEESLVISPQIPIEEFSYNSGTSRFVRLKANGNTSFDISYTAIVDTHYNLIDQGQEFQTVPVAELDGEIIPFLFPSRYCQSDKLQKLAYKEFGQI